MIRNALLTVATSLLAACSTVNGMNPVNWWHQQEGGEIARQRPAPPGANRPYPNLDTVPARPAAPNQADLKKLTDSLIADRTNAQHAAQEAPIPDPSSPTASPTLFGVGSMPPPTRTVQAAGQAVGQAAGQGGAAASASLPAVTAPASPPAAPSPAPRKPVQSADLQPSQQDRASSAAAPANPSVPADQQTGATSPGTSSMQATAAQPAIPPAPPPRPALAGPPPAPPPPSSPMPEAGNKSADVAFVSGTSDLSPAAADEVKAFAGQRGNAVIGVTGYGDTPSSDPAAQSAALNLGLARAQAIVNALRADGVPGDAIRVSAEASGRGASLHLLQ